MADPAQIDPKPIPSEITSIESSSGIERTTSPVPGSTAQIRSGAAPHTSPPCARNGGPPPVSIVRSMAPVAGSTCESAIPSLPTHTEPPPKTTFVWTSGSNGTAYRSATRRRTGSMPRRSPRGSIAQIRPAPAARSQHTCPGDTSATASPVDGSTRKSFDPEPIP